MNGRISIRWQQWLAVLGVLLASLGAIGWIVEDAPVAQPPAAAAPRGEATPGSETVVAGRRLPEATPAQRFPGDPLRLLIPTIDVDAPVEPILAPGGVLTPPADPARLGWWADGARPGDPRGSALVTGHTVHTGGGALDDLDGLADGDTISVASRRRSTDYSVDAVEVMSKRELAEEAKLLFSQAVPGRLVVVTCEDWNGEEYLSNVVVTATPVTRS